MCTQDDIEITSFAGVSYIVLLFINIGMVLTNLEVFTSMSVSLLRWYRWFALGWSIVGLIFCISGFVAMGTRSDTTEIWNNLNAIMQSYYNDKESDLKSAFQRNMI